MAGAVNLGSHLSQKYLFTASLTGAEHTRHCCVWWMFSDTLGPERVGLDFLDLLP